ncbi:MAG: UDP-N-acetylmuramate dehydrogenase, partial [Rickettsiaceae bacterium]|nr:UDP-N-acetylmuramate dehydrogenase [Rickettsiaceae bacterium]
GGIRRVVIKLSSAFATMSYDNKFIIVGGAALNYSLAQFALQHSIANLEFLCGIPGSLGGSIFMNAGCYGWEMKDIISEISLLDRNGNIVNLRTNEINFSYRNSNIAKDFVIIAAKLIATKGDFDSIKRRMEQITSERNISQPYSAKTAGSTFMNPPNNKAWQLIESVGLRGFKIGDGSFSEKHCNFLINSGDAKAKDLEDLAELAIKKVKEKHNIELIWEVKRLGDYE